MIESLRGSFRRRGWVLVALVSLASPSAACGGDDSGGGGDDGSGAPQGGAGSGSSAGGSGSGMVTVDGATYELTRVLDCTVGNEGAPDDRQFVGETDDGTAQFSASFFGEDLAGLEGISLEVEVEGNDWTWSSDYAADGAFEITLRDDGAEGSATVRVVGIDAPEGEFTATWSFRCVDDR